MTGYTIPYARFLLRSWGFTKKVPMGRHVKRASRQKIAWFRKKLGALFIFGDLEHLVFESELYGSCPESRGTAVRKWARSRVTTVQNCGSGTRNGLWYI